MIGIEKPRIEFTDSMEDAAYGAFVVEPLERGFGTTLGNSLRRVLLSSLPGYAITSVKIDGILHEFSTIPNVKEDVTEIVLNLKGVILKIHGDGPKIMYIEANGSGEITAGDIKADSELKFSTPSITSQRLTQTLTLQWSLRLTRAEAMFLQTETNSFLTPP